MNVSSLLLLLPLFQNAPPPPPPPPPDVNLQLRVQDLIAEQLQGIRPNQGPPGSLQGVVVEMPSGAPLAGATVRLRGRVANDTAMIIATSRPDGTFTFPNVPPGTFTLEAERAGYVIGMWGNGESLSNPLISDSARPVLIAPGQKVTGAQLQVMRGASISGRLLDDRGDPVVGASIQALKTTYVGGLRERTVAQTAISNDLGEYRLFMLNPGEYRLSVAVNGETSLLPLREVRTIPFYFPGTIDLKEAQLINLGMGQSLDNANFPSLPSRARRVTGTVQGTSDPAGVVIAPLNGTTSIERTANSTDGTFEFTNVVPGSYTLVGRTVNSQTVMTLDVRNADVLNVNVPIGAGYRIPVRVHIEGHPAGDDPQLENFYFTVRLEEPIEGIKPEVYSPFPDGHFTLDVLRRNYRIDIQRPDDYYVKTMVLEGVDVLNQGLQVTGSANTELQVLVANDTGRIDGRIDGRGATVVLVPDMARRGQRALFRAMQIGGTFKFDKVPPGNYKLFAWAEQNGGPWLDPEYLRIYEDRGIPVRVDAGKTTNVPTAIPVN